jgi:predicted AlkP superfamily pyrophosphatase or phosphodiesterase
MALCAGPAAAPPPSPLQPARPTLAVLVAVDQFHPDYLVRFRPQLTGGLARFLAGGASFTSAYHDHAITETAPGHASMLSGRLPRSTGIIRNLAGVGDEAAPLVDGRGPGASPRRFRGTTLTDWLTSVSPATRALSVSTKDRGAILPIGRSKQQVYWWSSPGLLTTSVWYADTLPDWVKQFNDRRVPQRSTHQVWELLLPRGSYPERDSVRAEGAGRDYVFPHALPADTAMAAAAFFLYPMMDQYVLNFALEGLERLGLGRGPHTDVLSVSLSTTDHIGHRYGPESLEIHDQILRLDRYLGAFIDSLYRVRDSARIVFALTGDHGVAPIPELHGKLRVEMQPALVAAQEAVRAAGGDPTQVDIESGAFFLGESGRAAGLAAFIAAAKKIPGVMRVDRFADLPKKAAQDPIARRWLNSFPDDLKPQAVVTLGPGHMYNYPVIATHGSPHDYDARVPLIFYGPDFKPGRYGQPSRVVDLGPTLAAVLGVQPTEPVDGQVLRAALR